MKDKDLEQSSSNTRDKLKKLYKKNRINLLRLCLAFWGFLLVSYPYKRFNDIEQYNTYNKEKNENLENLDIIEKCKESNTKYVNIFNEYDELINNTADFYRNTLNITDPIEALICCNFMIKSGYLSNEISYKNIYPEVELAGNRGLSIIQGNGVCRNNAILFNDILNSMGFNSYLLLCNMADKNAKTVKYNSATYRKYWTDLDIDFEFDTKETIDHILTVVEYNGDMYILDSTNNFIITREDDKYVINAIPNMDIISNYKFEPAFLSSYLGGYTDQEGLLNLSLNLNNNTISIKDLDKDKVKEYYNTFNDEPANFTNNIYDNFYSEQFSTIKDINNVLKLYKKKIN